VKAVLDSVVAPPAPKQKRETAAQQTAEMRRYRVLFTEWCKPQELAEDLVVNIEIVVDDDDDESRGEGVCKMCIRSSPIFFHHVLSGFFFFFL